ncbi:hypothetical protein AB4Y63_07000 [Leifsonia sp. YAF41]|uniref:P-type ATPase n=1 Tax=Leifsonia sp. YAF41 TaxID=3233086 RepID=UPI003F986C30
MLIALFAFWQEYRADRSAERLRDLLPTETRVRRDGSQQTVDASQLVRDDVVLLRAGDRIAADLTLTEAHAVTLDESMVTGESEAVHHDAGQNLRAGTFVVQGEAPTAYLRRGR